MRRKHLLFWSLVVRFLTFIGVVERGESRFLEYDMTWEDWQE